MHLIHVLFKKGMPPNFSPEVQAKEHSSIQETKDDNLNSHLCKTDMRFNVPPYGSKCHD